MILSYYGTRGRPFQESMQSLGYSVVRNINLFRFNARIYLLSDNVLEKDYSDYPDRLD